MSGEDWRENKKFVLEKIEEHGEAIDKQHQINKDQSEFNHEIDKRVTSITERIGLAVAGLAVFWTLAGDYIKTNLGKLLP